MAGKATKIFRKVNRVIHRDFGYFFFGITIIYCVSGFALNHKPDWNPNYSISQKEFKVDRLVPKDSINKEFVLGLLKTIGEEGNYKKHYFPTSYELRVFLKNASTVTIDLEDSTGYIEKISKRPFLFEFNYLHYNPGSWWVWFSDAFCGALILIAVSGLIIIPSGKNALLGRGIWFLLAGLLLPVLAIFLL